jgi:putative hemolysin
MNTFEIITAPTLPNQVIAGVSVSHTVLNFIILGVLLLLSAIASGSESAFFSLGPNEKEMLKNDPSRSSKIVLQLLENPKELLATLLITNNFVNVGVVILSSSILNELYPVHEGNETIRFLTEVVGITFAILLIGEVIPKIWSSKNALFMSKTMAYPIYTIKSIPPLSWLKKILVKGTNFLQRRARRRGVSITTDELEQALALTKEDNTSEEEHKILEGIVKFGNTEVSQIMRPRPDVLAIDFSSNFRELLDFIREAGYSRIPVYRNSLDDIAGILFIKDLLPFLNESDEFNWTQLMRKPFFVPENKKIDDLLKEFQEKKMHMAVVVDEYGGSCGLITLEDILEEIVGDITDEFDDDEIVYSKINEHTYVFEGRTALVDFYKVLNIDNKEFESERGDADTIGGFIIEKAGRILKNNEFITFGNVKMVVESSDKKRIKMVKTIILEK